MVWPLPTFPTSPTSLSRPLSTLILQQPIWLFIIIPLTDQSLSHFRIFMLDVPSAQNAPLPDCHHLCLCNMQVSSHITFIWSFSDCSSPPSSSLSSYVLSHQNNDHYLKLDVSIVKYTHFVSCLLKCKLRRSRYLYCSSKYLQHQYRDGAE